MAPDFRRDPRLSHFVFESYAVNSCRETCHERVEQGAIARRQHCCRCGLQMHARSIGDDVRVTIAHSSHCGVRAGAKLTPPETEQLAKRVGSRSQRVVGFRTREESVRQVEPDACLLLAA